MISAARCALFRLASSKHVSYKEILCMQYNAVSMLDHRMLHQAQRVSLLRAALPVHACLAQPALRATSLAHVAAAQVTCSHSYVAAAT